MRIEVSEVRFTPSTRRDRDSGLLGFVSCVLNDAIKLDGITLRRTRDGKLTLSYPSRRDRRDVEHFIIAPLGDAVRLAVERQVFEALGAELSS